MKLNLGHYITISLIFFVCFIGFMVFRAFQQNVDLVADDYYKQEVEFQQTINKKKNASTLSEKVKMQVKNNEVLISFPKDFTGKDISGNVHFYNPVNQKFDFKDSYVVKDQLAIPLNSLKSGKHTVKLNWKVDGVEYYYEDLIVI